MRACAALLTLTAAALITACTTPGPAPRTTSARFDVINSFPSAAIAPRRVTIYLPEGYDAGETRYPVIYMQDGQNLFDAARSSFGAEWEIDETMTRLVAEGRTRAAIVVGIDNTPKRFEEYMPQKAATGEDVTLGVEGFPVYKAADLISDRYLDFIVNELKPAIDARYRTLAGRADTFMMGASMGAAISLYAVSEYPGVFGGAAAVSMPWPIEDGALVDYFARALPEPGAHLLYFDHGDDALDSLFETGQRRMDAEMVRLGYRRDADFMSIAATGAEHNEKSWAARVDRPLTFLLGQNRVKK